MRITNVRIYGLEESAIASGYPMMVKTPNEEEFEELLLNASVEGDKWKPFDRLCSLGSAEAGSGHDSALKGVIVQFDLTCNHAMLPQIMRYHFADIVSSQSKMHKILSMDLKSQCDYNVDQRIIDIVNEKIDEYKNMINDNRNGESHYTHSIERMKCKFEEIISNTPIGLNLTMRWSTNYLQLKSQYSQRSTHKMGFWGLYCDWIETLPLMDRILQL